MSCVELQPLSLIAESDEIMERAIMCLVAQTIEVILVCCYAEAEREAFQ